ncbi:hypothetical protein GOODEAATRI_023504, partial [Goodea atripinnis]
GITACTDQPEAKAAADWLRLSSNENVLASRPIAAPYLFEHVRRPLRFTVPVLSVQIGDIHRVQETRHTDDWRNREELTLNQGTGQDSQLSLFTVSSVSDVPPLVRSSLSIQSTVS